MEQAPAHSGAPEGVGSQALVRPGRPAVAAGGREPRQPWRSLMVLLAMIFGVLLARRRRSPAA
jgi:hypothetical protein